MARKKESLPSAADLEALIADLRSLRVEVEAGRTELLLSRARAAQALQTLLARYRAVRIEQEDDGEGVRVCVTYLDDAGRARSAWAPSLAEALLEAVGAAAGKVCSGCRAWRPLSMFGKNRCQADGLLRRCRLCERARLKEFKGRKRAAGRKPAA